MTQTTLILGAGINHVREDHKFAVDILHSPNIDLVHNLDVVPWPLPNDQFIHASAMHVVEHLQSLITFMNECHRVLKLGGSLYIETPLAGADPDLEFADPTHVRCYRKHSFINYFTLEGIRNFGYTDKAWAILFISDENSLLKVHLTPIK